MNAVEVRDGAIFWRGSYRTPEEAERLREQFARTLKTDWFYPAAQGFAKELADALAAIHHQEIAA